MAIKQFAIPLDENSDESGDINFKALADAGTSAEFKLTNVSSSTSLNELNLITKKNDATADHKFSATVVSGSASVVLTTSQIGAVYSDAVGGNWDYVEAKWTVGAVDTPDKSELYEIQNGRTYNLSKWPPNS